jgi:hypothetical protein
MAPVASLRVPLALGSADFEWRGAENRLVAAARGQDNR